MCPIHGRRERRWRHLNFWQYETWLVARVPRTRCAKCGTHQVGVPWARPGSGFTLLFEAWALLLAYEMPVSESTRTLGIRDTRLWRMLCHHVDKAHAGVDWGGVTRIGVDETSRRKGHRYVTCFVDLDSGRLLHMGEGKDAATVGRFAEELALHRGSPSPIREVAMDMGPAFQGGVGEFLPGASKVFDRNHVMALAGAALDRVRREVAREAGGGWRRGPPGRCGATGAASARGRPHNAAMEGLNSKLQLARKRARGYRNWKNFRTIAHWVAGGLKPAAGLPNPLPQRC